MITLRPDPAVTRRVVVLGYGTIATCLLDMMLAEGLDATLEIVAASAEEPGAVAADARLARIPYRHCRLREETYRDDLARLLGPGDLLVNLAVSVDCLDLADWCQRNGVLYIDTAFEPWDGDVFEERLPPEQRTVYWYHAQARGRARESWRPGGPTAVFGHGANPGLVSHFVKAALLQAAESVEPGAVPPTSRVGWAELARTLDVRVVHFSERDTQVSSIPRRPGHFHNTWSIVGFIEEASRPSEIGWGTHERTLPPGARAHGHGPGNALYVPRPAVGVGIRSYVPRGGAIIGIALPHSECITTSEYLTVSQDGVAVYRPTVAYSYLPCDAALSSILEVGMQGWAIPENAVILNEDIVTGADELGVLMLGPRIGGLWYGSYLDVASSRAVLPGHNPTAVQVAAGALGALVWVLRNPARGFCEPEDLPFAEVLETAGPYLGELRGVATDWLPEPAEARLYPEMRPDGEDPYQFARFLARSG
ncbi:saccharopine dehydrogenase NADP-binding domain-containing protein [Salinarimonas sp. NSM]|uniref:saccharopine dehydrogenase NADP-binding domain-containing protein n=1 Tax=Salinarimonas sp. NSM TaxID=3458003 RepID=UPI004036492E